MMPATDKPATRTRYMNTADIQLGDRPAISPLMEMSPTSVQVPSANASGASMVYTEFVSAGALVRSVRQTVSKLNISDENAPWEYKSTDAMWSRWWKQHALWNRHGPM